jgi:hypothetical protein
VPIRFDILSDLSQVELIATGRHVRCRAILNRRYGRGNWRKMKGVALIHDEFDAIYKAEIHWYEAHGIGRRDFKIKGPV